METYAVRHPDAVDVSLYPLLEQGAAKLCQEIYEHCKFIGKSQIMEETLLYIVSEDITRSEFKLLSEDGLVTSADSEGVDKGNYFYAVVWHLAFFHASRHYPTVKELYQQVAERYPTLALEHKYTKKSIVMKGDVLEVSLAKASVGEADLYIGEAYMARMRMLATAFDKLLPFMCKVGVHIPVRWRPPVWNLASCIILAPATTSILRDEDARQTFRKRFEAVATKWQCPFRGYWH